MWTVSRNGPERPRSAALWWSARGHTSGGALPHRGDQPVMLVRRSPRSGVHPRCIHKVRRYHRRRPGGSWGGLPGSSPRVRGTQANRFTNVFHRRFIPAGAGNARAACGKPRNRAVHPRGCGERSNYPDNLNRSAGSSPRVRGTHLQAVERLERPRFIPAGAGNAVRYKDFWGLTPVHPRGCGERSRLVSLPSP